MGDNSISSMLIKWKLKALGHRVGLSKAFFVAKSLIFFFMRRPHEIEFKIFSRLSQSSVFADIGANAGQSFLSIRMFAPNCQVISFEANPLMANTLRIWQRIFSKFSYECIGLGSECTNRTLFLPKVDGVPMTQEATLDLTVLEKDPVTRSRIFNTTGQSEFEVITMEVPIKTLDSTKITPDVIKMDCQGFELEVLKGMRKTLMTTRPLLMIENSELFGAMNEFLIDFEYAPYIYDPDLNFLSDVIKYPPSSLNVFFLPVGKERRFQYLTQVGQPL